MTCLIDSRQNLWDTYQGSSDKHGSQLKWFYNTNLPAKVRSAIEVFGEFYKPFILFLFFYQCGNNWTLFFPNNYFISKILHSIFYIALFAGAVHWLHLGTSLSSTEIHDMILNPLMARFQYWRYWKGTETRHHSEPE